MKYLSKEDTYVGRNGIIEPQKNQIRDFFLYIALFAFVVMVSFFAFSYAYAVDVKTYVPINAKKYLPDLNEVVNERWSDFGSPQFFASQIEQESCVSLTNSRCWDPRAELKTSREYGFGLGQITIAYRADHSVRFDNFQEAKKLIKDPNWEWNDRFNPSKQMMTIVEMNRGNYLWAKFADDEVNRIAFMFVAYNSGRGGIMQDRVLCNRVSTCNENKWWNNVELRSTKSKVAAKGYGRSFFEISREYPKNIMYLRADKYIPYFH